MPDWRAGGTPGTFLSPWEAGGRGGRERAERQGLARATSVTGGVGRARKVEASRGQKEQRGWLAGLGCAPCHPQMSWAGRRAPSALGYGGAEEPWERLGGGAASGRPPPHTSQRPFGIAVGRGDGEADADAPPPRPPSPTPPCAFPQPRLTYLPPTTWKGRVGAALRPPLRRPARRIRRFSSSAAAAPALARLHPPPQRLPLPPPPSLLSLPDKSAGGLSERESEQERERRSCFPGSPPSLRQGEESGFNDPVLGGGGETALCWGGG